MAQTQLRSDNQAVLLQELSFVIVSSTLDAEITIFPGTAPGMRSGGVGLTPAVLQSADVREMGTVVLEDHRPEREQEKSVTLYVPGGYQEDGRLLLYFDEDGGVSFHLPHLERQPSAVIRAGGEQPLRFDVPIRKPVAKPADAARVRGVGGMIAKKVLKIIGWKVLGAAARQIGPALVRCWEDKYRPMRVLDRESLFVPDGRPSIERIPTATKSLLFIHGTFSRVAQAFSGIPDDAEFMSALDDRYGKHVYGFDHATLATGVATNVMQLYDQLSPGDHNFDIICHSRGGLVARALRDMNEAQLKDRFLADTTRGHYDGKFIEWGQRWRIPDGVQVNVNRIVFGGTPNNGTVLAQPTHLKKYLETLMTATNLLPEVVDVTVDSILATAKLLISDIMPILPGLDDQQPQSSLIPLLQGIPRETDAAIQADYEPPPGLQAIMRLADTGMDLVFGNEMNDLVVPTDGVSKWAGVTVLADRLVSFDKSKGVFHSSLFRQGDTRNHLLDWLAYLAVTKESETLCTSC